MFHALFILLLILILVPMIIGLVLAGGLWLGAGVAVAGENICRAIYEIFGVTIKPIGDKIGWFAFAMIVWLILFVTST